MNNPLVSVCMPAYNAEKYIEEAIKSILNQSYKNLELIIVNDGSTDDTLKIINSFTDLRIKHLSIANSGQSIAANKAFELSKGDYVKFFDADDILSSGFIEAQIKTLKNKETAVASAKWGRFYNDSLDTFKLCYEECWKDMNPIDWLTSSWNKGEPMMQCALWLIPRAVINISGLWNEKLSVINDFEFFTRIILASSKVKFTEDAILYYRSGISNSLSGRTSQTAIKSAILSATLSTQYLLDREESVQTKKAAANCLINLVYQYGILYPQLLRPIEMKVKLLGGSSIRYKGGSLTKLLSFIFGWRFVAQLQKIKNG